MKLLDALWPAPDPRTGRLPADPDVLPPVDLAARGCRRCAEDHGPHLRPATCPACEGRALACRRVLAARSYDEGLRRYLLRLKRGAPGADPALAAGWLAPRVVEEGLTLVVPVPNTWLRQLHRGVNSAESVAREIAREAGLPWRRVLARRVGHGGQQGRGAGDRRRLDSTAFRLRADVSGARVALVDDVYTTGATAEACARVLLEGGARDVCAVVVARRMKLG